MIPYGKQDISKEDIDAVVEVLKSPYLTQGPRVPVFEDAITAYCGSKYGVAVNSATSALHLACIALNLIPGDILWTSPISFVASANCALYCGAKVDFVDIDLSTHNMCPRALKEKLEAAAKKGRLPKIVIPVHMGGDSCCMREIYELGQEYGFKIIEDASHAIGGSYLGKRIGNCAYSDITIFSFHPVKIITTAEGGMAVTNNDDIYEKLILHRSHGITRDPNDMTCEPDGGWYYQQIELGYNYRMTELQAALGISQLGRIDHFIERRHEIKAIYDDLLQQLPLDLPTTRTNSSSALHLYVIKLKNKTMALRKELFDHMRSRGVGVNVHYIPIHLQPYYQKLGFSKGDFPQAENYYKSAISIPMHPNLEMAELQYIAGEIEGFFSQK